MQIIISQIAESDYPAYENPGNTEPSGETYKPRHSNWFFSPMLAPLLQNRRLICIFATVGVAQLILVTTGWNGWQCPIRSTFGVICPGCGLSTAMTLLVKGHWAEAVRMHVFAPLFLMVLVFMAAAIALPAVYLKRLSVGMAALERKTGVTAIMMLGMVLYWLLRVFVL